MRKHIAAMLVAGAFAGLSGCASHMEFGTKLDAQSVAFIQKGKTTRTEVEQRLGAPAGIQVLPDGRRQAMYSYMNMSGPAVTWGWSTAEMKRTQATLQVVYNQAGTVQDYEFSSGDKTYEMGGPLRGYSVQQK